MEGSNKRRQGYPRQLHNQIDIATFTLPLLVIKSPGSLGPSRRRQPSLAIPRPFPLEAYAPIVYQQRMFTISEHWPERSATGGNNILPSCLSACCVLWTSVSTLDDLEPRAGLSHDVRRPTNRKEEKAVQPKRKKNKAKQEGN